MPNNFLILVNKDKGNKNGDKKTTNGIITNVTIYQLKTLFVDFSYPF